MDGQPVHIVFRMQITPPQVWLQSVTRMKKIPLGQVHSLNEDIEDGNMLSYIAIRKHRNQEHIYISYQNNMLNH